MTAAERDIYQGLARTFRDLARCDLQLAGIAHRRGNRREMLARIREARDRVREARRWEAVVRMGQA